MAQALTSSPGAEPADTAGAVEAVQSDAPLQRWLDWQCGMLEGALQASVFTVEAGGAQLLAEAGQAHWSAHHSHSRPLMIYAATAVQQSAPVVSRLAAIAPGGGQLECISVPLPGSAAQFVFSVVRKVRQSPSHAYLARLVISGGYWLHRSAADAEKQLTTARALPLDAHRLLAHCSGAGSLLEAGFELVNELASALGCDQVCLGLVRAGNVRLKVISGLVQFDPRVQQLRLVESAMQEAWEQAESIDSAADPAAQQNQQHRGLAGPAGRCLSIALADHKGTLGILTLQGSAESCRAAREMRWLENTAALLTPVLRLHLQNEQSVFRRLLQRWGYGAGRARAMVAIGGVALLLGSLLIEADYRITANATIEGADKQAVVAPYAGFILSASVRAGQQVEAGQVLASLDSSALQLEKEKWSSELDKVERNYARALASGDRVELSLARALREEYSAELQLVSQRMQRSQIRAPFSGMLVSGDLNQMLGAPVEQGQVLFEIASMERFRLMLDISEQAIADIRQGQQGTVRLASIPGATHALELKTLQPVAVVADGKNVFRMEAELKNSGAQFRPGMHGVAKISAGQRSWFWLLTHRMAARVRIGLWSLGL